MLDKDTIGTVARLWRYPVKSMLGERCEYLDVAARGVIGDRLFAVRHADGKLGSGKSTRRFRKTDGLLGFSAAYRDSTVEVRFPDGGVMRGDESGIHDVLSGVLGQPVTLAREADVPHLDAAAVHVLTTASLAWLQAALPDAQIGERRFRPNLVLEVPGATPVEQSWLDSVLCIGDEVKLRIVHPTERCGMVAMAQTGLNDDARILRHITQYADLQFGVYAEVVVPGRITLQDRVTLLD